MRIRTVKPEFWRSDDIDALSIEDRLLFIGLWSYVDDSGVGVDKESAIAADLFAGDLARDPHECSVRVHGGLKRLTTAGLVARYTVDGRRYLHISAWSKHQKINRPSPSRYPPPTCKNAVAHDSLSEDSASPHPRARGGTGEQGNRGTGEEEPTPSEWAPTTSSPSASKTPRAPKSKPEPDPAVLRAQKITREYVERVPMSKFPAVLGVVRKAVGTELYDDSEITSALLRMAADGRSVTVEALRVELEGHPANRSRAVPTTTQRVNGALALLRPEDEDPAPAQLPGRPS